MKIKRTLIALVLCTVLLTSIGCAASPARSDAVYAEPASGTYDMAAPQEEKAASSAISANDASSATQQSEQPTGDFDVRKIVYNADMTVTVDDPAAALSVLVEKAKTLGGYVSGSYSTTAPELSSAACLGAGTGMICCSVGSWARADLNVA